MSSQDDALVLEQTSNESIEAVMGLLQKIHLTKDVTRLRVEIESSEPIQLKDRNEADMDVEAETTNGTHANGASVDFSESGQDVVDETDESTTTSETESTSTATRDDSDTRTETKGGGKDDAVADTEDTPTDETGEFNDETMKEIDRAFQSVNSNSFKALRAMVEGDFEGGITRNQLREQMDDEIAGLSSYLSQLESRGFINHNEKSSSGGFLYFVTSKGEKAVEHHMSKADTPELPT